MLRLVMGAFVSSSEDEEEEEGEEQGECEEQRQLQQGPRDDEQQHAEPVVDAAESELRTIIRLKQEDRQNLNGEILKRPLIGHILCKGQGYFET